MPPLDDGAAPAAAPVEQPSAPAPEAPYSPPVNSLDALLDAQIAELEAAGVRVDDENFVPTPEVPAAPETIAPPAQVQTPAAAPTGQPANDPVAIAEAARQHAQELARALHERDMELARRNGVDQERQRQADEARARQTQQPGPPRQVLTPRQVLDQLGTAKATLDKAYDDGEIEAPAWRTKRDAIVREEAIVIARAEAQAHVAPVARHVQAMPAPPSPKDDPWLRERTAQIMAQEPWLARVPGHILKAFEPEAVALAKRSGTDINPNTALGIFNFRRCIFAAAKGDNLHLAYGDPGGSPGAASPTAPAPQTVLPPGASPIPAPPVRQPPSLATHPSGTAGPIGGVDADRLVKMSFFEAAEAVTDAELEAIAPSR